jgi:predicted site-specific integrase-resolvase
MDQDLLTYTEAAEILGVAPNTVCQYCKPGRKKRLDRPYPRAPLVTRESVERYAAERRGYERKTEAAEKS